MSSAKTFEEFYNNELKVVLEPLEQQRKKTARADIAGFTLLGVSILFFIISSSGNNRSLAVIAFISFIVAVVFFIIGYNRKKKYVSAFKENIIQKVIHFIDPDLRYNSKGMINRSDYDASGLFLQSPDRYNGDDYIEGTRDKTFFSFSELHTEKKVSSGKNTTWVTIFKGLFFIGDFNKHFHGRTYVWSEKNPQLNFFTKLFSSFSYGIEKVNLESIDFENRFIVYSSDQVEARYILTPSFMERLVRLEQLMGKNISFSFVKTNIYVALPVRNKLFEPSLYKPNDYHRIADYYNTVHIVFDIIDELRLNDRLWTKE
jgi:Ca2+/Na+ antiporter